MQTKVRFFIDKIERSFYNIFKANIHSVGGDFMTLKLFWDKYYIAIIFVIASVLMGLTLLFYASTTNENKYSKIDVSSGDSLWVLADEHAAKANMDKATFIKWVEKENHINDGALKAGDEIIIPVKKNQINQDSSIQLANE